MPARTVILNVLVKDLAVETWSADPSEYLRMTTDNEQLLYFFPNAL